MQLADGTFECTLCGVILDVPEDRVAMVESAEISGRRTDSIIVDGVEIHRCQFPPDSGAVTLSLVWCAVPVSGLLLALAGSV